jgi:hypothetical protein
MLAKCFCQEFSVHDLTVERINTVDNTRFMHLISIDLITILTFQESGMFV